MALFALMVPAENAALEAKLVEVFKDNFLKVASGQWILIGTGTAKEISDKLGITTGVTGTGIVLAVSGYYGRSGTNVWEWIASKSTPTPTVTS